MKLTQEGDDLNEIDSGKRLLKWTWLKKEII